MEQAALVYMDLLEGNDKPVAGSTCKGIYLLFLKKIII